MSVQMHLLNFEIVKKSKCLVCEKKEPVVLVNIYQNETGELSMGAYCKDCFKEQVPEYSLENKCLVCNSNFDCSIQNLLFSKKEIRNFKKEFWG